MIAHSLTDVVKLKGKVSHLILQSSKDLVCSNLWCEHVTGPCICRLERTLDKVDCSSLISIDLSGNHLSELPPSVEKMVSLREINLSNNNFQTKPAVLARLSKLQHVDLSDNPTESGVKI